MRQLLVLVLLAWTFTPVTANADTFLLMAEEDGCFWCQKWHKEIAHIYPKTREGRTAPLQRYQLRAEEPSAQLSRPVHFTPTFILVQNGVEVGRIEGYPGEDFFWGLLSKIFNNANIDISPGG